MLEPIEAERLRDLEATIERGLRTFAEVGAALLEIRDGRLYRGSHKTFEAYLGDRWNISRAYAHRTIEAAQVVQMLPMGNKPKTERHEVGAHVHHQRRCVVTGVMGLEDEQSGLDGPEPQPDETPGSAEGH